MKSLPHWQAFLIYAQTYKSSLDRMLKRLPRNWVMHGKIPLHVTEIAKHKHLCQRCVHR